MHAKSARTPVDVRLPRDFYDFLHRHDLHTEQTHRRLTGQLTWIKDVVFAAIEASDRPVKLIFRAAFGDAGDSNDPALCRKAVESFVQTTGTRVPGRSVNERRG